MKSKLIKPARINKILNNCTVFTKVNFECEATCAAKCSDLRILSYPLWHNNQDIMCSDIKDCDICFLQQRNVLNIIKYIKKNKLHTELCYTKKTTKQ